MTSGSAASKEEVDSNAPPERESIKEDTKEHCEPRDPEELLLVAEITEEITAEVAGEIEGKIVEESFIKESAMSSSTETEQRAYRRKSMLSVTEIIVVI